MKGPGVVAWKAERWLFATPMAGGLLLAASWVVLARTAELRATVGQVSLLVASLLAGGACWRRARGTRNELAAYRWLALAAALGVAISLGGLTGNGVATDWLFAAAVCAFAVGAATQYRTERSRPTGFWLETAIVLAASLAVTLELLRAVPESISSGLTVPLPALLAAVALAAALCFALLRLANGSSVTWTMAGSAIALGIGAFAAASNGSSCCVAEEWPQLAVVLGWLLLSAHAFQPQAPSARAAGGANRELVAPAALLFTALLLIYASVRTPLQSAVVLVLGVLGILLTLRMMQLLHGARQQAAVNQELAQSRSLIEISNALAGASDLEATFEMVTRLTSRSLNGRGAGILLLVEGSQELELQSEQGFAAGALGRRLAVPGSFAGRVIASGEPRSVTNPAGEARISPDELALVGNEPFAMAPLLCRGDAMGALCCIRTEPFSSSELELLGALADYAALAIENAQLFEQVHALSLTDPLTGLANRRQLERDLGREFAAARRGRRLAIVMLDLNGFKDYNDRFGHLAGDQVLRALAEAMSTESRAMNLAARYGGDEFVALLTDSDAFGAQIFVDRVRKRLADFLAETGDCSVTVSAGIAEYSSEMTHPTHLFAAADLALYASKGRRSRT